MTDDTTGTKPTQFNWTDPLNRLIWQRAFKARDTSMVLRDGKTYTIDYRPGVDRDGKKVTKAWVKKEGWVGNGPCGWFTVETVLRPEWVRTP